MMDRQTRIAVNTSHIGSNLSVGNLYVHKHWDWVVILIGLEHSAYDRMDGYNVEFIRLHDWRTFYATYTASEWDAHWTNA